MKALRLHGLYHFKEDHRWLQTRCLLNVSWLVCGIKEAFDAALKFSPLT